MSVWGDVFPAVWTTPIGATGDGVTDDTVAMQRALDSLPDGGCLLLRPGAIYAVSNLTLPSRTTRGIVIFCPGVATILALNSGNSKYLVASNSYVNNNSFVSRASSIEGVKFDGGGFKDFSLVLTCWVATVTRSSFTGGTVSGLNLSETTIDGVTLAPSVVDNRFMGCEFSNNTGDGFRSGAEVTDYQIIGGTSRNNGGWGYNIANSGGVQIVGVHAYTNTSGSATFGLFGFATHIADSIFDGGVTIPTMGGTSPVGIFGPHNTIQDSALTLTMGGAGTPMVLEVSDCHFMGTAYLLHNYNGNSRKVIVQGGTSEDTNAIRWTNQTGEIYCNKHWSKAAGTFLDGMLNTPAAGATAGPAGVTFYVQKDLTAASTTTTIVLVATLSAASLAGVTFRADLSAINLDTASANVRTYQSTVLAGFARKAALATVGNHATVVNEISTAGSGMSAAAVWGFTGTVGDIVATCTITLTHIAPSASGASLFTAAVTANHQYITALTVT